MLGAIRKPIWEDAFAAINSQINASGVHEWKFDPAFPVDLRFFVMRRELDIRPNHHAYYELLYVYSGEVEYQVFDRSYRLKEGDLFVMGGALAHRISEYGRSRMRCVALYFEPELIRAHDSSGDDIQYLMPFLVQSAGFPHTVSAKTGIPGEVFKLMKRIYAELPIDSALSRLTIRTYLKMILVILVNHYSKFDCSRTILTQKQRDLDRLHSLFEFIESNYMHEISVSGAAKIVNMSKSHFMRFFRRVSGQPFTTHLNQFRVAKAQQLLVTTDRSIADVGQEVGFCNQSYFGLVFRRLTHLSPREYKMRIVARS